jgi:hypothetical protein
LIERRVKTVTVVASSRDKAGGGGGGGYGKGRDQLEQGLSYCTPGYAMVCC